MMSQPRTYTDEFKQDAVNLVVQKNYSIKEAAEAPRFVERTHFDHLLVHIESDKAFHDGTFLRDVTDGWGHTAMTSSNSQFNRVGRRGGQLKKRARSP